MIVGGTRIDINELACAAPKSRIVATHLNVGIAAHTPLLAAAVEAFRMEIQVSTVRAPTLPVIAGINARPVRDRAGAVDTLARQVAQTIHWSDCLETLAERGCRVFLELGPGKALATHVRERWPDAAAHSVDEFASLEGTVAWLRRKVRD